MFGLDTKVQPFANQAVPILTNSPGVSLRIAMLRIPPAGRGLNFELTEFTNTERKPAQPKMTDPGAPHMKFMVRDHRAGHGGGEEALRRDHLEGGRAVDHAGRGSAVFMRDPDGYIVEADSGCAGAATRLRATSSER